MRHITHFAITLLSAATLAMAPPAHTSVNAIGSTPVRTFAYTVGGIAMNIPTGCMFTHIVRGGGRRITYQNAGVDCAFAGALNSGFCNWRIDFAYADTDNRVYRTSRGRVHTECRIDPMRGNSPQTLPRYGKACARLHVNGTRLASQCHHITR